VTYAAELEHSYRRWLRCYPRSFRADHETEILDVLLAGARDRQRRPDLIECLDLMRSAIWMRLRPNVPRRDRSVFAVIRLMYLGAVVELAVAFTVLATSGSVESAVANHNPGEGGPQGHAAVLSALDPLVLAAGIAVVFWLAMAWSHGRGHRWTPIVFAVFFAMNTDSLLQGLLRGSAVYARADLIVGTALWLIELAVLASLCQHRFRRLAIARSSA
jgi:hypothetical protein